MNNLLLRRIASELGIKSLSLSSCSHSLVPNKTVRQLNTFTNHILRSENLMKCLSQNKCQPIIRGISTSQEINLFTNKLSDNFVEQKRYKKGKKGSKRQTKEDSSDEESDAEQEPTDEFDPDLIDGKAIGFQDLNAKLVSLRLDNVLKAGLNMARTRVDEAFYQNLIRVNGERVSKKSAEIAEDDEIDIIKGWNSENNDLIDVDRVVLKKIEDKMSSRDRVIAKLRKFRNLSIENYPKDPYDGSSINIIRQSDHKKEDKE